MVSLHTKAVGSYKVFQNCSQRTLCTASLSRTRNERPLSFLPIIVTLKTLLYSAYSLLSHGKSDYFIPLRYFESIKALQFNLKWVEIISDGAWIFTRFFRF